MRPRFCRLAMVLGLVTALSRSSFGDDAKHSGQKAADEKRNRVDLYGDPLPPGAVARLGTMQLRQDTICNHITAFSPDGKLLATGSHQSLRLWELATGRMLWQITDDYHIDRVFFTPDSRELARLGKESVGFIDAATGREARRIPVRGSYLAFSPDGRRLATTTTQNAPVEVWDKDTGKLRLRISDHEGRTAGLQYADDGKTLLAFDFDDKRHVRISRWDANTGAPKSVVTMAPPQHRTMTLSRDGRLLAVVPYSRDPVQLWDAVTGQQLGTLLGTRTAANYGLAFSADSRLLATDWTESGESNASISFWDVQSRELIRRFTIPLRAMGGLQFTQDGRALLSDPGRSMLCIWDALTGQRLLQRPAHEGSIASISFTPDGKNLISGADDGVIRIWESATGRPIRELPGHAGGVSAVAAALDGGAVLSGGYDAELLLRDWQKGRELQRLVLVPAEKKPRDVSYAPYLRLAADGRTAACLIHTPAGSQLVSLWDLVSGRIVAQRNDVSGSLFAAFSPDARSVASFAQSFAPASGQMANAKSGALQVVGSQLAIHDVATGRALLAIALPDRNGYRVTFAPDGRSIVSYSSRFQGNGKNMRLVAHVFHLWELATGQARLTIVVADDGKQIGYNQMVFTHDRCTFAAVRSNGMIECWDIATGKQLQRHPGHVSAAGAIAFSPDDRRLAIGYNDSSILIWDMASQTKRPRPRSTLSPQELEQRWADLATSDTKSAHAAIWALTAAAAESIPFLRQHLQPAPSIPVDRIRQLLADLDSSQFKNRAAASRQLADVGEQAEPALRDALSKAPSAEVRNRLEALLARPRTIADPQLLRSVRAVEILDQIGTPATQEILQKLAAGAPEARLTKEAKTSLARLAQRRAP